MVYFLLGMFTVYFILPLLENINAIISAATEAFVAKRGVTISGCNRKIAKNSQPLDSEVETRVIGFNTQVAEEEIEYEEEYTEED